MADPTVEVWALDEVHFQQHGSRCRMWVPPEVRDPVSLHHPTRKQVGYFGAVRLSDGRFHYQREPDRFNAKTCWAFLKSLRRACKNSKKRVIVISDNARCSASTILPGQRQLFLPIGDNYELCVAVLLPYTGAGRSRG